MTAVSPSPMSFSHSDNDLARHLGLLGEHLDTSFSQEFSGLPSVDFASILNNDMLPASNVKLEEKSVSQSPAQDAVNGVSDEECCSSDDGSDAGSDSDDDTATAPQQPDTPRVPHGDLPEASAAPGAVPAANSLAEPSSPAGLPVTATSPCLRAVHPALPPASQGFVALSDINTAGGQGNSHSVSSSPSSALAGTSSTPFDRANTITSSGFTEQKGKRKADQMDLSTILDPAEKKKQRRLAKNRATAALSRERKKAQLQVLQQRVRTLEQENTSLAQALSHRDAEIKRLKDKAAGQLKGAACDSDSAGTITTEVAKNPGPRIVYPTVSSLPRIYRSVANPPSSSFPHQPRAPAMGHPPVGATTHFPQRSVFSAPILEHAARSEQPSMARSDQHQAPSNARSQPVRPAQSVQLSHSVQPSQSGHPSQSGQQTSAVAPGGDPTQQEATSHLAATRAKPAASGFQSVQSEQPTISIQPSTTQTPFNVVTSGESGPSMRRSNSSAAADKQRMAPPAVDTNFTAQISPFVAQSEHSLHIQQAPHAQSAPVSDCSPPQEKYTQPMASRSGSFSYAGAYPSPHPSFMDPQQEQAHAYTPNMHSHTSSHSSAGWQPMPQYHYPPQQQQQSVSIQSWPGYEESVRTSPRHPGAWQWSDGMGQNQMEGLHQGASANWDSHRAQSSHFSAPSCTEWRQEQPWHTSQQQQSDASGSWAGPVRPPWPPQAIAVTPQGSAFGHTVGPLTEPHRLPGELEPPACRWMASANSALADMFPVMPSMPQMPTGSPSLAWMDDFGSNLDQNDLPDL